MPPPKELPKKISSLHGQPQIPQISNKLECMGAYFNNTTDTDIEMETINTEKLKVSGKHPHCSVPTNDLKCFVTKIL